VAAGASRDPGFFRPLRVKGFFCALAGRAAFLFRRNPLECGYFSKREPTRQACVTTAVVASPRDHARKRAQGATVLTAFDNPMLLSLQDAKGSGAPRYFPLSAIIDRFNARNQLSWIMHVHLPATRPRICGLRGTEARARGGAAAAVLTAPPTAT